MTYEICMYWKFGRSLFMLQLSPPLGEIRLSGEGIKKTRSRINGTELPKNNSDTLLKVLKVSPRTGNYVELILLHQIKLNFEKHILTCIFSQIIYFYSLNCLNNIIL